MGKMIQETYQQFAALFKKHITREKLPYIIIVLMVLSATASNVIPDRKISPVTNQNPVTDSTTPTSPNATSSASTKLEIISYQPLNKSTPSIANTKNTISVTFNQPITNSQVIDIVVTSLPPLNFRKIIHVNRKTLFIQPLTKWENNKSYLIMLNSPDFKTFSFQITPTDLVDPNDVITETERF